jgi:hypothetical protein
MEKAEISCFTLYATSKKLRIVFACSLQLVDLYFVFVFACSLWLTAYGFICIRVQLAACSVQLYSSLEAVFHPSQPAVCRVFIKIARFSRFLWYYEESVIA